MFEKGPGVEVPENFDQRRHHPGPAGLMTGAEASYYTWVDQHDTLALGNDVPISTGNENDALLALVEGK